MSTAATRISVETEDLLKLGGPPSGTRASSSSAIASCHVRVDLLPRHVSRRGLQVVGLEVAEHLVAVAEDRVVPDAGVAKRLRACPARRPGAPRRSRRSGPDAREGRRRCARSCLSSLATRASTRVRFARRRSRPTRCRARARAARHARRAERLDRVGLDAELRSQAREQRPHVGLERLEQDAVRAEHVALACAVREPRRRRPAAPSRTPSGCS